jgi:hypothetical protein
MIKHYFQIGIVSLIVLAAIIFGFTQVGLPMTQRDENTDQTRASNLSTLESYIQSYYYSSQKLPVKLSDLSSASSQKDPETGKAYEYKIKGSTSYQLCATFKTDSAKKDSTVAANIYMSSSKFNHPKGYHCFDLKVTSPYQSSSAVQKIKKCKTYGSSPLNKYLIEYVVKEGDTLSSIAQAQLGDASRANEVAYINNELNSDINDENSPLTVGWKIYIPPKDMPRTTGNIIQTNGEIKNIVTNVSTLDANAAQWSIDDGGIFDDSFVNVTHTTQFKGKRESDYKVGDCISVVINKNRNSYVVSSQ